MDRLDNIANINKERAASQLQSIRHQDSMVSNLQLQETIVQSFKALTDYMERRVGKTVVMNQLREIGTPDALKVVAAIQALDETVKAQPTEATRDVLSEMAKTMQSALEQLKELPKKLPEAPEQKFVDYTEQLKAMEKAVQGVEKAVQAQEFVAEAPDLTPLEKHLQGVKEAVEGQDHTPDLKPLEKHIKAVEKAVKAVIIPEPDFKDVINELKKSNKKLDDIAEHGLGGSSGGGGSIAPFLNENQELPVAQADYATQIATDSGDANVSYIGKAAVGSATSSAVWQIKEVDENSGTVITFADGNSNFDNVWDSRESLTYS